MAQKIFSGIMLTPASGHRYRTRDSLSAKQRGHRSVSSKARGHQRMCQHMHSSCWAVHVPSKNTQELIEHRFSSAPALTLLEL